MGVRNCRELGENLQKIVKRLMANDRLVNLLYYEGKDPLGCPFLTEDQKKKEVFNKLIKIIPRIDPKVDVKSVISIRVVNGTKIAQNNEFRNIQIIIEVIVPFTQWIINDSNLRPFAILGEIQESLDGKRINGLGQLQGGDFEENFLTNEASSYIQSFELVSYD